jgi:hypothetical protein
VNRDDVARGVEHPQVNNRAALRHAHAVHLDLQGRAVGGSGTGPLGARGRGAARRAPSTWACTRPRCRALVCLTPTTRHAAA